MTSVIVHLVGPVSLAAWASRLDRIARQFLRWVERGMQAGLERGLARCEQLLECFPQRRVVRRRAVVTDDRRIGRVRQDHGDVDVVGERHAQCAGREDCVQPGEFRARARPDVVDGDRQFPQSLYVPPRPRRCGRL